MFLCITCARCSQVERGGSTAHTQARRRRWVQPAQQEGNHMSTEVPGNPEQPWGAEQPVPPQRPKWSGRKTGDTVTVTAKQAGTALSVTDRAVLPQDGNRGQRGQQPPAP